MSSLSRILARVAVAALPLATFAVPAVAAGPDLSSSEQQELQRAVDAELAKHGGRQVAPNKVVWANGGAATTIPYPNQRAARALSSSMGVQWGDPSSCAYGNFCVYTGSGYTGNRTDFYNCRAYTFYDDFWSYVNNQTSHTVATLYLDQPGGPDYTPGAWHGQFTWNGLNYSSIKPC